MVAGGQLPVASRNPVCAGSCPPCPSTARLVERFDRIRARTRALFALVSESVLCAADRCATGGVLKDICRL
jgi:hypothetical protein